jgi:hypothetical protein
MDRGGNEELSRRCGSEVIIGARMDGNLLSLVW